MTQVTEFQSETPTPQAQSKLPILEQLLDNTSSRVLVVAHRGCWQRAPENSLASIRDCIESGVDMVELDVRQAGDGGLVLLHDETVDRTTSSVGLLESFTTAQVTAMPLKAGAGGITVELDPSGETVPSLREALELAKGKIMINIDAKQALHDAIFEVVAETGTQDQVLIKMRAAPDDPSLVNATFHGRALFMPVVAQCDRETGSEAYCVPDLTGVTRAYGEYDPIAYEIVYTRDEFLLSAMDEMRARGRVWVNTLSPDLAAGATDAAALEDPDAVWGELVERGVNMIQTDYPMVLMDYLEARGYR